MLKIGIASFGIALLLLMLTFIPIDAVVSKYFGEYEISGPVTSRLLFLVYFLVSLPISVKFLR